VHKDSITACLLTPDVRETRTFKTTTRALLDLGEWLVSHGVTDVAMESTGVFWKPVYNVLESFDLRLLLANAQHIKTVPGRKTDVKDAEWIADLLQHGLLRASFVPDRGHRELRELVRRRRVLVRQTAQCANQVQQVLEGGNIKLSSVATDVLGVSGREMIEAMIAGTDDPKVLAALARGRMKAKQAALEEALLGLIADHQRFLLASLLRQVDFLDAEVEQLSHEVERRMAEADETDPPGHSGPGRLTFSCALELLDTIPGVNQRVGEDVLAEIGLDMSRFPSDKHLGSWACLCPGNRESAGKRHSGRTRRGNPWLRSILTQAARGASKAKSTYLSAMYHRLVKRLGDKRAILAVAHAILTTIYHVLSRRLPYVDLGHDYFDLRGRDAIARNAVRRLERLGYSVTLQEVAA
jgi:transposase